MGPRRRGPPAWPWWEERQVAGGSEPQTSRDAALYMPNFHFLNGRISGRGGVRVGPTASQPGSPRPGPSLIPGYPLPGHRGPPLTTIPRFPIDLWVQRGRERAGRKKEEKTKPMRGTVSHSPLCPNQSERLFQDYANSFTLSLPVRRGSFTGRTPHPAAARGGLQRPPVDALSGRDVLAPPGGSSGSCWVDAVAPPLRSTSIQLSGHV